MTQTKIKFSEANILTSSSTAPSCPRCTRAVALGQVLYMFSDDKSFSPLFDCFHIMLKHSAQLLIMTENLKLYSK
ncbi:hypothetical protein H5410_051472 [Solanum commersonii]|uniref:Uncharacterized protein n=1 Tax=Solanum commersonii TaxID=4109 RepID=A0A9J5X038_SOLCO|nr:hypothetical protein H5410_051472 [Solanum commersonii]